MDVSDRESEWMSVIECVSLLDVSDRESEWMSVIECVSLLVFLG